MAFDADGFQRPSIKKKQTNQRIYIGNLPQDCPNLPDKLIEWFHRSCDDSSSLTSIDDIQLHRNHAFLTCKSTITAEMLENLSSTPFEGKGLSVQREKKKLNASKTASSSKRQFASKGWSTPKKATEVTDTNSADLDEVAKHLEDIVRGELENAERQGDDMVATMIAASAAVTCVLGSVGDSKYQSHVAEPYIPVQSVPQYHERTGDDKPDNKDMPALLTDYGEQDANWKAVKVDSTSGNATESSHTTIQSRLGQHGKAPLHVEIVSFGYHHGAPAELRQGASHAQPLPPFDTRDLIATPNYLAWQDGLSGAVKHALAQSNGRGVIQARAKDIAQQIALALVEAMNDGHGYASPLRMTVFVGSESGRHRSVVVGELTATALRKILRSNDGDRFAYPSSVGTRHRDVELRKAKESIGRAKENED